MTVGRRRAAREEGGFSYRNALIVEFADQPAAMILSYALPDPYELNDIDEYPVIVQPLVTLESQAAGTWYINAVATYDQFRGQGLASRLMDTVESMAMQNQFTSMSLIVADSNQQAKRLYTNRGYQQTAVAAVVPAPGLVIQGDWVLMIKSLD